MVYNKVNFNSKIFKFKMIKIKVKSSNKIVIVILLINYNNKLKYHKRIKNLGIKN